MRYSQRFLYAALLGLSTVAFNPALFAQDCLPDKARSNAFIYDYAEVIPETQEESLQSYLAAFTDTTNHAIVVVTHPDLCGLEPSDFAVQLGRRWGVGIGGEDNGIVLAVRPKTRSQNGGAFIAVGYGLEGQVTDLQTGRIVDEEMIPHFKREDYGSGIAAALQVLAPLASGELVEYNGEHRDGPSPLFILLLLLGIFIFIVLIIRRSVQKYADKHGVGFWAAWALLNALQNSSTGQFRHFKGGSGHFGSGGGGFGGFGGGSFGGGGAGGSW
ncbi:MAG: TPM domain-containing protein [Flavobacteriales bacterium]|nr:TPM domain-containing protein [Flavobacteriales bacterium]